MIINLLNQYQSRQVTVTGFALGTLVFDAQLEEAHESVLYVSENALESGALAADHSVLSPKTYSVRGIFVSYSPPVGLQAVVNSDLQLLKRLPFLNGIVGRTEQAIAKVNRYAGQINRTIETARKIARRLGPLLPTSLQLLGDRTQDTLTRQQKAYDDFLTIQANGEFLTISTGLRQYTNMLLTRVVAVQDVDDALQVQLEFREVFITETRTVQGLVVQVPQAATNTTPSKPDAPKTGRAKEQSAKPKSKGTTQPTQQPQSRKSVARSIGDIIRGL